MKSSVATRELAKLRTRKISRKELLNLLELRNHIDSLERIYLRRREGIALRIIAGAKLEEGMTLEEILNCLVMDLCE